MKYHSYILLRTQIMMYVHKVTFYFTIREMTRQTILFLTKIKIVFCLFLTKIKNVLFLFLTKIKKVVHWFFTKIANVYFYGKLFSLVLYLKL